MKLAAIFFLVTGLVAGSRHQGVYHEEPYRREESSIQEYQRAGPDLTRVVPRQEEAQVESTPSKSTPSWLLDCRENALARHNEVRPHHNSPRMAADDELDNLAQNWAEHQASTGYMQQSSSAYRTISRGYVGENLASGWTGGQFTHADMAAKGTSSVQMWYDQYPYYNPATCSSTDPSKMVGSFTQVVWKASTLLGTGCALTPDRKSYFVVSHYLEGGNMIGWGDDRCQYYTQNVNV